MSPPNFYYYAAVAPHATTPLGRYQQCLATWTALRQRAQRWHDVLAWARVAALVAVAVTWYSRCAAGAGPTSGSQSSWALGLSFAFLVATFVAVSVAARRLARALDAEGYYQAGIARLQGGPPPSDRAAFEPTDLVADGEAHPFAADLDLFGADSLYTRLNMARTSAGQRTLGAWLLGPAPRDEVLARQGAVAELAAAVELREELWRAAGAVGQDVRTSALESWLAAPAKPVGAGARVLVFAAGLVGMAGLGLLAFGFVMPALVVFAVVALVARRYRAQVANVGHAGQSRADELAALVGVAELVEKANFQSPRLKALKAALGSDDVSARQAVTKLASLIGWFESRRNPLFGLLSAPLLLSTQLAFAIEAWRQRHGAAAARWMAEIGKLEALASLATFAFEHPALPFPEIAPDEEGPLFVGTDVAHPLLPVDSRVPNDVTLDRSHRLLLVTGSNMSGKSTYLRTIGANTVLALAGAPVVATKLRLSRLHIGASLRTSDSLQAGVSRFFAEIKRLRGIAVLAESSPLSLFLLDEILHGTNSEDRLAGASALIKRLVATGGIGLCTTHDLALARIVDEIGAVAANVHFEDVIQEGEIRFDYKLRPGVVTRSNALALMRLVGLPV